MLLELAVAGTPEVDAEGVAHQEGESEISCGETTAQRTRHADVRLGADADADVEVVLSDLAEHLRDETGWPVRTKKSLAEGLTIMIAEDDVDRSGIVVGQERDGSLHVTAYSPCHAQEP
ncbi:hypothetical protein [Frigoribacterium salinisoli]